MKQQPLKIALCKKLESDLGPRWWFTHCWQPESETHIYQCTVLKTAKQEALVVKVATWWHTFDLFTYCFQLYLTLVFLFFFPWKTEEEEAAESEKACIWSAEREAEPEPQSQTPRAFRARAGTSRCCRETKKECRIWPEETDGGEQQTNKQTLHVLRVPVALCYNHYPRMMSKLGFELLI